MQFPSNSSHLKNTKKFLRISGIIIPLGAWGFFLFKNFNQLQNHNWELSLLCLTFSLFFGTLYFLTLALSWAFLVNDMAGVKHVTKLSVHNAMRVWLLTIMTRYLPGNIWHVLSRMAFTKQLNVLKLHILSSSTIEQGLAVVGAMLTAAVSFPFWPLASMEQQWMSRIFLFLFVFALGLAFLHPRILGPVLKWAGNRLHKPELKWDVEYTTIIRFVLIYALAAFIAGLALVAVLSGLGELEAKHVVFLIGSSALAWVVGYLSFITPSGLGVREGVLTALLAIAYPLPIAIVASLLFRIVCTLGEFLALLSFLGWSHFHMRSR